MNSPLTMWHRIVETHDASGLNELLAEDVAFYSPVVHTPQRGKKLTAWYCLRHSMFLSTKHFVMSAKSLDRLTLRLSSKPRSTESASTVWI